MVIFIAIIIEEFSQQHYYWFKGSVILSYSSKSRETSFSPQNGLIFVVCITVISETSVSNLISCGIFSVCISHGCNSAQRH